MPRYIDADALIERLGINQDCTECSYCTRNYFCSWNPDPGEICIAISEQPTVTINDLTEGIKVTDCNYKPSACGHENVKDVIYRQDAIDALDCINGVEEVLKSLPSAQPDYTMRCSFCDMSICTLKDKPCSRKVVKENG